MKVSWERLEVETAHPFRISRSVRTRDTVVWLRLELDGIEAWGEANPSPYYGESVDTVERALESMRARLEDVHDPFALESIEHDLRAIVPGDGSAHAAISAALHDWVGKRLGQPLWRLFGLDPAAAPLSSFTIGIDEPEVMAARVREASDYQTLKIKVGTGDDEPMLRAVRDAAPEKSLRVDANAAWTPAEALEGIAMLVDFGVEFVEQPVPPEDRDGLAHVHAHSPLPIIVDESCIGSSDIPGLVGRTDGINIKLAKCGGPREALRMIHTARASGLKVMLGCMLETTLGIAASAHISPLVDYADLDGAALLKDDPFQGPHLEAGRIVLGDEPGLGVTARA
jgi:L-alanine-DL-glutamate epimerase-like enolase superfamily enzyme